MASIKQIVCWIAGFTTTGAVSATGAIIYNKYFKQDVLKANNQFITDIEKEYIDLLLLDRALKADEATKINDLSKKLSEEYSDLSKQIEHDLNTILDNKIAEQQDKTKIIKNKLNLYKWIFEFHMMQNIYEKMHKELETETSKDEKLKKWEPIIKLHDWLDVEYNKHSLEIEQVVAKQQWSEETKNELITLLQSKFKNSEKYNDSKKIIKTKRSIVYLNKSIQEFKQYVYQFVDNQTLNNDQSQRQISKAYNEIKKIYDALNEEITNKTQTVSDEIKNEYEDLNKQMEDIKKYITKK